MFRFLPQEGRLPNELHDNSLERAEPQRDIMYALAWRRRSGRSRQAEPKVLSMRPILFVVAFALLAVSCSSLWNRANRIPFQEDVEEVLAPSGVTVVLSECQMEGTTRTGYCELEADPSQIEAIISSLKMGDPQPLVSNEDSLVPMLLRDSPCLGNHPSSDLNDILAYLISGRPNQLELADGGQFEYLFIAVDPANNNACIEASYSYG